MPTEMPIQDTSTPAEPTVMPLTPTISLDLYDLPLNSAEDSITQIPEGAVIEYVDEYLCNENEEVLMSFNIANSDKAASICLSKNKQDYIIYRYGTKDNIELEYPEKSEDSWSKFTYTYYLRGGGDNNEALDLNYLSFENGGYNYDIYEEYSSESDDILIGIVVTNLETGEETDIKGDSSSLKGSMIGLRDNEKINIIIP